MPKNLIHCALLLSLLGSPTGAIAAGPAPIVAAADVEEDLAAFEEALAEWEDRMDAAEDSKARRALRKAHPAPGYADRMRAHAKAGEPLAADWLLEFLTKLDLRRKEREALRLELYDVLLEADGPRRLRAATLERMLADGRLLRAVGLSGFEAMVVRFVEAEEDSDLRGRALLGLAGKYGASREDSDVARAVGMLERLLERAAAGEVAEDTTPVITLSRKDRGAAETLLFRLKHLRVGGIAPDFTGRTIDGETVTLADLRGRVTVLDFFGFW